MRSIQIIAYVSVFVGILAITIPIKFYTFAMGLFTIASPPPFSYRTLWFITLVLSIPSITLILNGAALLLLEDKIRRLPELKVFAETGEYMGEMKGVEVEEGEAKAIEVEEGVKVPKEEISGVKDVVVVKKEKEPKGKKHFIGKEVFTELGEFMGYVEDAVLDKEGEIVKLEIAKGGKRTTLQKNDIVASNGIIMVKVKEE